MEQNMNCTSIYIQKIPSWIHIENTITLVKKKHLNGSTKNGCGEIKLFLTPAINEDQYHGIGSRH